MSSIRSAPVAIVGGGFAGTMLAVQLARRGIGSIVADGSDRLGRGTAYSTRDPAHLLNIPADRMSAFPDEPDHFARHFATLGGEGHDFAQRREYGRYLDRILAEARKGGLIETVAANAIGAARSDGTWRVSLDNGETVTSRGLALAIGNQQPGRLGAFDHAGGRYIANPWGEAAQSAIADAASSGDDVLVIGTGLTMIDLALSIEAAGHQGRILALSRRGLMPRSSLEGPQPRPSTDIEQLPLGDLRAMTRWLRRESASAGWRNAVDGLRPHSHALWQAFDVKTQRRFMRHARPYWDVHRHRIAPQVARTITGMIADGRLEVAAGRVIAVEGREEALRVSYRRRGSDREREHTFAYAFNSTGPLHAMSGTSNPLLRSLIDSGEATADALDIGLAVDADSRVAGSNALWALGALSKGRYWEIIAVPDIRVQVAAVADGIARELER